MSADKPYLIYCLQSPKKRCNLYVGQTKRYKKRMEEHQKEDSGCTAIAHAIQKYGWENMKQLRLIEGLTVDQANYWEEHYISIFANRNDSFHNGLNLTTGGDNYERSQTTRGRMSATHSAKRENHQAKKPETRANMSVSAKARCTPKYRVKMAARSMGNTNAKGKRSDAFKASCMGNTYALGCKHPPRTDEARANHKAAALGNTNAKGKRSDAFKAKMMGNTRGKGKRSDDYKASITGENNPNSKTNKRRKFIAKCFDGGVYNWY